MWLASTKKCAPAPSMYASTMVAAPLVPSPQSRTIAARSPATARGLGSVNWATSMFVSRTPSVAVTSGTVPRISGGPSTVSTPVCAVKPTPPSRSWTVTVITVVSGRRYVWLPSTPNEPPPREVNVAADSGVPSPQSMVPAKLLGVALALPSVKVASE